MSDTADIGNMKQTFSETLDQERDSLERQLRACDEGLVRCEQLLAEIIAVRNKRLRENADAIQLLNLQRVFCIETMGDMPEELAEEIQNIDARMQMSVAERGDILSLDSSIGAHRQSQVDLEQTQTDLEKGVAAFRSNIAHVNIDVTNNS